MRFLIAALMLAVTPAHAFRITGDCIAVGTAQALHVRTNAVVGEHTPQIVTLAGSGADTLVVSAGSNDNSTALIQRGLSAIHARNPDMIVILPAPTKRMALQRAAVASWASANGVLAISFERVAKDNVHPSHYSDIADQLK